MTLSDSVGLGAREVFPPPLPLSSPPLTEEVRTDRREGGREGGREGEGGR